MSNLKVNSINDASGGSNTVLYGVAAPTNSMGFRNRILNGGMVIDQRNAGASVTPTTSAYTLDRWQYQCSVASKMSIQQNAGSVTPPVGFSNYLGLTTASAYTAASGEVFEVAHKVEGFNFSDLNWGSANASSVTLSFWARSSLTGTHSGSFTNSAGNRSYPFTYTISAANTWEYKTITVAGDTTGTWVGATNGTGVVLYFDMGSGSTFRGPAGAWAGANYVGATGAVSVVGTSGATFYITGVQLEAGSVASPFERRDYGRELMMCQRYYQQYASYYIPAQLNAYTPQIYAVPLRAAPALSGGGAGFTNAVATAFAMLPYQTTGAFLTLTVSSEL